jgi:hypothetical protein
MKNKLTKLAPAWHAEAAQMLNENFGKIHAAFTDATKRAVWLGLFLNDIKARGKDDGSIPHGQFMDWCKNNIPDLSYTQLGVYMKLALEVCEKGHFQINGFREFAGLPGHLPPKIEKMIEGKTQQQLFLQFKNVDDKGEPMKPGNAPGKRRTLSLDEQVEAKKMHVADVMQRIQQDLETLGADFMVAEPMAREVFDGFLIRTHQAIKAYEAQPKNGKNPAAIVALFKH